MVFLYYVVIFLHVVACLFLVAVVLLQQGKGQDLASAFGGGGSQTAFGPRGSANVLSRATTILATIFMLSSLGLSVIRPRTQSPIERLAPAGPAGPAEGSASPAAPGSGSPGAPAAEPSGAGGAPTASPAAAPAASAPAPPASPTPEKKP